MPDSSSWDVIFGTNCRQVILGVDFPGRQRQEAGFPDLATRIGPGYRFLQTKPPTARSCQRLCGDAHVGAWIKDIQQDRRQVVAVLGHRIGSVYAAAIAEGVSRWQPMPKIILFDPQFFSVELLGLEFQKEISSISSLLGDDELKGARKAAAEISQAATGDVASVAAEIVESYVGVITAPFERAGLGDARSNKFTRSFDSYISWLAAAGQINPSPVWKHSTGIASSAYGELPANTHLADDDRSVIGQLIPFDLDHADLLRSDSVARAVLDLLESR